MNYPKTLNGINLLKSVSMNTVIVGIISLDSNPLGDILNLTIQKRGINDIRKRCSPKNIARDILYL
jgi:hypothetical protein